MAYVRGLAKVATSLGVTIYEHSAVAAIEKADGYWYTKTSQAHVKSERVIIATNAYTEGEWTELAKTFYLVDYYQVASEPLSGPVADRILPYRTGAWDTRLALSSFRQFCPLPFSISIGGDNHPLRFYMRLRGFGVPMTVCFFYLCNG